MDKLLIIAQCAHMLRDSLTHFIGFLLMLKILKSTDQPSFILLSTIHQGLIERIAVSWKFLRISS